MLTFFQAIETSLSIFSLIQGQQTELTDGSHDALVITAEIQCTVESTEIKHTNCTDWTRKSQQT